jgi:cysteine desulfurase
MFFNKHKDTIYFDHAATTPIDDRVFEAMLPYLKEAYGNPSALYKKGVQAKQAIETARTQVASALFTQPDTITFTGSATEANNIAFFGIARAHSTHGKHIITTKVEHEAILAPCKQLEQEGFEVTYLDVDETGQIDVQAFKDAIRPDTILISIMHANNEVGTVYPIAEIGKYLLRYRKKNNSLYPLLHTDACQAVNYLDMSVERLHVDLLTLNASKIYGPKGVGALYVRRDVAVQPIIFGGGQEDGLRSGTENVPAIVGFGMAIEIVEEMKQAEVERLGTLQTYFWQKLRVAFGDGVVLNGPPPCHSEQSEESLSSSAVGTTKGSFATAQDDKGRRLPNNLNVSFLGYEGETIVLYLDAKGICASTGSACTTDNDTVSHVLSAMKVDRDREHSAVRFTMGRSTTKKGIDTVVAALKNIFETLK